MDENLKPLLRLLADGNVHSGQSLGETLGISRAAVWKQLGRLEESGITLQRVRGKGYCLSDALEVLDAELIRYAVTSSAGVYLHDVQVHESVDSTNGLLLRQADEGARSGLVCLAETQTQGRGRRGRPWVSPYGCNLYMSVLWRYASGVSALEGLSLVAGLMVLEALEAEGVKGLSLKWPNDVVAGNEKLAGILLEMGGDPAGECHVVLGIGVNMDMPAQAGKGIDQRWTDASRVSGCSLSRNGLAGAIISRILPALASYDEQGFAAYRERWSKRDACEGKSIRLLMGDSVHGGRGAGVDSKGAFRLQTESGIRSFHGGEISLRVDE